MRVKTGESSLPDVYKFYKTKVKEPVPYSLFHKICWAYNKELMREILEESQTIQLPYRLGYLRIRKRKMNFTKPPFDYGEWRKTGLKAYHTNWHSDDFICKFHWEKSKAIVKGKTPYCFKPTRDNQRKLAQLIKSKGHKLYFE